MLHDDIDPTLIRYFSGQLPPEELVVFERWLAEDPARGEEVERLRAIWEASAETPAEPDVEAALARFRERVEASRPRARSAAIRPVLRLQPSQPAGSRLVAYALRIAAAVALAAGAGLWYTHRTDTRVAEAPRPMRVYQTARGERADFHLVDGTHVILGMDSQMQVPAELGAGDRTVHLEGEAYFEVQHDPSRRFLVRAGNAVTEDLGTRFAVRAYPEDSVARVVVAEGKVVLRPAGAPAGSGTALSHGELGGLDRAGVATVTTGVDVSRYLAWTEGRLVFDDTPLREALPELSRWYDIECRLADSALGARRLTATVSGEALPQTLDLVASSLDLRYERHGRIVTFYSASRPRS